MFSTSFRGIPSYSSSSIWQPIASLWNSGLKEEILCKENTMGLQEEKFIYDDYFVICHFK